MTFDYPYTLSGKLRYFPYKFHWQRARPVRYFCLAATLAWLVAVKIQGIVREPKLLQEWKDKKRAHKHGLFDFDPATEPKLKH